MNFTNKFQIEVTMCYIIILYYYFYMYSLVYLSNLLEKTLLSEIQLNLFQSGKRRFSRLETLKIYISKFMKKIEFKNKRYHVCYNIPAYEFMNKVELKNKWNHVCHHIYPTSHILRIADLLEKALFSEIQLNLFHNASLVISVINL